MATLSNVQPADTSPTPRRTRAVIQFLLNNGIILALIVEVLIFAWLGKEKFVSIDVFKIILQNASIVGIIMPVYTMAMISGQVDFSTTQVGALAGTIFALLLTIFKLPWWVAGLAAIAVSIIVGALNSWVIIRLKIPSIVATLVVGALAYGIAYLITDAYGNASLIRMIVPQLRQIWSAEIIGIPATVWIMIGMYVIVYIVLNHTKLGAHLYALGANPDASRRTGIKVSHLIAIVMMVLAMTTGIANVLFNARGMSAGPNISPALTASGAGIAVTLVGALFAGIGLFGGTGRVEFTLVGLLFFSILLVGMSVIDFPAQVRVAVDGIAIVFALLLDSLRRYYASR